MQPHMLALLLLNLEIVRSEKVLQHDERIKRLKRSLSKNLILDPENLYTGQPDEDHFLFRDCIYNVDRVKSIYICTH